MTKDFSLKGEFESMVYHHFINKLIAISQIAL